MDEYTAVDKAKTGGIPRKVTNVTVQPASSRACVVTWNYTSPTLRQFISGYKITISESLAELAFGSSQRKIPTKIISISTDMKHVFYGEPNRRYSFGIQATTCAGAGDISESSGDCVTEKQAPYETPSPKINSAVDGKGKAVISIAVPDQTNGPISCLFVMVRSEANSENAVNSIEQLLKANSSNSSNSDEYTSVSLVVQRLDGHTSKIILGDDTETSCDIYSINATKRRSLEGVIVGNNRKLNPENNHSVYTLSTTPSNGRVYLRASKVQSLSINSEENTEGQANSVSVFVYVGVAVSLFVLVAVCCVAAAFVFKRRREANVEGEAEPGHIYEYPNIPMGLVEEAGYENFAGRESHGQAQSDKANEPYLYDN